MSVALARNTTLAIGYDDGADAVVATPLFADHTPVIALHAGPADIVPSEPDVTRANESKIFERLPIVNPSARADAFASVVRSGGILELTQAR